MEMEKLQLKKNKIQTKTSLRYHIYPLYLKINLIISRVDEDKIFF